MKPIITPGIKEIVPFFVAIFFIAIQSKQLQAQLPDIIWQNTIGGMQDDILTRLAHTSDGGAIIGGTSLSGISADKTEGVVGGLTNAEDFWIVKVDATGAITWQNTIGGSADDFLTALATTPDGGYIVGGYSNSNIGGDKTVTHYLGGTYGYDYWVLKLNSTGGISWQKSFGGLSDDYLMDIEVTDDGGFIVAGSSYSGVSGNKTASNFGMRDYWILKLDAAGNVEWEKNYGGNNIEILSSVHVAEDGGFLLAGHSWSPVSGNKSEGVITAPDYWIIKTDAAGNILWQNNIGGNSGDFMADAKDTPDGGAIIVGQSSSGITGDKNEWMPIGATSNSHDYWVLKLNNSGVIEKQNTIGGNDEDDPYYVESVDDGYMVMGHTISDMTGDLYKTSDGYDFWVMHLDYDLNITWQYIIGGSSVDYLGSMDINASGELLAGGASSSPISGDKTENYKGGKDYWVLKINPEDCVPQPLYTDFDHDSFGTDDGLPYWNACVGNYYTSLNTLDCSDTNDLIHPLAVEMCDGFDNDCVAGIDNDILDCNPGPSIINQNTLGAGRDEYLTSLLATDDGGYLIGGYSFSNYGWEKTNFNWDDGLNSSDYWIVKVDANLNVEWNIDIGGTDYDKPKKVLSTTSGGYFIAGTSSSPISGNKTESSFGPGINDDYWVVALDASGNILWDNTIGGSGKDDLMSATNTIDGGFLLIGTSDSPADFDKSEPNLGAIGNDYWVVKLNSTGNIEWQNTIGGSNYDLAADVIQTADGGYLVGGSSYSPISGDKTESPVPGASTGDYWVLKLDAAGNIVWQNTIGGNHNDVLYAIIETQSGEFLLCGNSLSGSGYDKTEPLTGALLLNDIWIVKIDATGNVIWDNTIGTTKADFGRDIIQSVNGNYIVAGYTSGQAEIDKKEQCFGVNDFWLLELNIDGDINWQNTIGSSSEDYLQTVIQKSDGTILTGGYSKSNDFYDKEEINHSALSNYYDYWIVELASTCVDTEICNAIDDNCNGLTDDGVIETISINTVDLTTFCQGGSATLTATHTGTSLQWKKNGASIPGATGETYIVTTKGNYSCVTGSDCATAESTPIFINVNKNPNANITAAGATTFCVGGSVVLNANAGAGLSYQWFKNAVEIPGATSISYTATVAGIYKCKVIKTASGCFKMSNGITVTVPCKEGLPSGEAGDMVNASLSVYPNPATDIVIISFDGNLSTNVSLQITNAIGQTVYNSAINAFVKGENIQVDVSKFPAGIYEIRFIGDTQTIEQQFIVQ